MRSLSALTVGDDENDYITRKNFDAESQLLGEILT